MADLFSNVKCFKKDNGKVKGNGTVLVAGAVEVQFTIIEGKNGLFVSLPQDVVTGKDGEKKYYPRVKIPDEETYKSFQKFIIDTFKSGKSAPSSSKKETKSEKPAEDPSDDLPF